MFSSGTDFQLRCPIEPVRQVTDVGESGHYKTLDARQQQGDKQPTFRLHTDVAFALDRFTQLKTIGGNREDTHKNVTNLNLMDLPNGTFVKTLLSSCTYFSLTSKSQLTPEVRSRPGHM